MQNHRLKIMRLPEVIALTGLSRSTIYAYVKHENFPQPVKIGLRAMGWREGDVLDWIEARA